MVCVWEILVLSDMARISLWGIKKESRRDRIGSDENSREIVAEIDRDVCTLRNLLKLYVCILCFESHIKYLLL